MIQAKNLIKLKVKTYGASTHLITDTSFIKIGPDEDRVSALEDKYRNIGFSLLNVCNSILSSTNGEYQCCGNPDTAKMACVKTIFAGGLGLSSSFCTADDNMCSDTEATSPGGDILSRIESLKTKAANVGVSLGSMCLPIDKVISTTSNPYDCCANSDNNQMRCLQRAFSAGSVTAGSAGSCLSSDALCNTNEDENSSQDELGALEVKAKSAAVSLGSTCQAIEVMANGDLHCCANSDNGQMGCIEAAFTDGSISANGIGVCASTDSFCNQGKY